MKYLVMVIGENQVVGMRCLLYFISVLLLPVIPYQVYGQQVTLPQEHEYQVVLRNYMKSLTEDDFKVDLKLLSYDFDYFTSMDDLFRTWILFRQAPPQGPIVDVKGITVASKHFTLSSIETSNGIMMGSPGNFPWISPEATVWWAAWDYPGNPYFGNEALMRRAFVYSAVDMIMHDAAHEEGKYKRSDYLGATLTWMAYTYYKVKDILPPEVQKAYETGLIKFFERIEKWGPRGNAGDMDQYAHIGMWYTAKAISNPEFEKRAKSHSKLILSRHLRPAGYIDHGDGFDPSYNGISLDLLGWAALATEYEMFAEALDKMSKLKAHLTLPEPDGRYYGPSHFSTATSKDSPNDLRGLYRRDIGIAMVSDHAKYLVWEGRSGQNTRFAVPDQNEMLSRVSLLTNRTNNQLRYSDSKPDTWRQKNWTNGIIYAYEYYKSGFYDQLVALNQEQNSLRKLPINRDDNYIISFPEQDKTINEQHRDEFVSAKFDDYAAILHTGRLSHWGGKDKLSGFGGGAISAFWTKGTGTVILGRIGGFQGPKPDTWENWREWPTHAISGMDIYGEAFSSARYRYPDREYHINGLTASVIATGSIGNEIDGGRTTQLDRQNTQLSYSRNFDLDLRGLTISTDIQLIGRDEISELYEIIPIFLGGDNSNKDRANTRIHFRVENNWVPADNRIIEDVEQIKIERHSGKVYIDFTEPQSVKLSPSKWQDQYQSDAQVRNIMIDLLNGKKQSQSGILGIEYTINVGH